MIRLRKHFSKYEILARLEVSDPGGKRDSLQVEINILDSNDNTPKVSTSKLLFSPQIKGVHFLKQIVKRPFYTFFQQLVNVALKQMYPERFKENDCLFLELSLKP